MSKVCGNCQKFLAEDVAFCPTCGARTVDLQESQGGQPPQNGYAPTPAPGGQNGYAPVPGGQNGYAPAPGRQNYAPAPGRQNYAPAYAPAPDAPIPTAAVSGSEFDGKLFELLGVYI